MGRCRSAWASYAGEHGALATASRRGTRGEHLPGPPLGPIGVYEVEGDEGPEPGTEYARYAAHVLGMLRRGETAASISHYLMQQATQSMGVGPGPTRTVAEALHAWWNEDGGRLPIAR
jgi:hypothetical protein